jgi:hypothetical protein
MSNTTINLPVPRKDLTPMIRLRNTVPKRVTHQALLTDKSSSKKPFLWMDPHRKNREKLEDTLVITPTGQRTRAIGEPKNTVDHARCEFAEIYYARENFNDTVKYHEGVILTKRDNMGALIDYYTTMVQICIVYSDMLDKFTRNCGAIYLPFCEKKTRANRDSYDSTKQMINGIRDESHRRNLVDNLRVREIMTGKLQGIAEKLNAQRGWAGAQKAFLQERKLVASNSLKTALDARDVALLAAITDFSAYMLSSELPPLLSFSDCDATFD